MEDETLQAIDLFLEDCPVERLESHFRNIFLDHLKQSDGYEAEILAEEYEFFTRLLSILRDREIAKIT
jgi:hypothetical protein